ncbi:ABC transporter ATP-binding protein [Ancylobacter sp. 6x-1]|uniref:ABC transporter ATP-binding protein n=1 Tax=Ancylobacter crimeensis TaxID=2579147 RepID=A0ABT0DDQ4_9HYPH|nr:ABC transporter ATP-binding protein [Ancylobacter crimeensis]MCK0198104.1 ABC transporter ATP-binding protein [Ancylobacter crimeensis]
MAASSDPVLSIRGLSKTYATGQRALENVDLEIRRGEIFALLGPNGAGKTTLIGAVCGLVQPTAGTILVDGHDAVRDFRAARARIGLVPQELATDMFETVHATVSFSRGLFGKRRDRALVERILRGLSLWEKRDAVISSLSGGMKRRVLIAKALAHEPVVLFLDEPTAGVDVELRRDMWAMVRRLREEGVTIILTTHYIEEAEEMADRVGIIDRGTIVLVEEKTDLMRRYGQTRLSIGLAEPLDTLPAELVGEDVALSQDGLTLTLVQSGAGGAGLEPAELFRRLGAAGLAISSVATSRSSLEDIFVDLVSHREHPRHEVRS